MRRRSGGPCGRWRRALNIKRRPISAPPISRRSCKRRPPAPADNSVGQVATLQGSATVTRGNAAAAALQVADPIFKNDTLATGADSSLGVTFDDETTFSLSADTRIVVNEFVYQEGGAGNAASFNVAIGTAAFVASLVAKTGDMTITTPDAAIGIRGTTGVVEVPAAGGTAAPTVKLYPDADGHVGQIDVFDRQGNRLGALTQGASAFAIRPGAGGRMTAVPYRIPPQEAARDRGVLQRLNVTHNIGRQMLNQRRQLRSPNRQRPNNQRPPGGQRNFRGPPNGRPRDAEERQQKPITAPVAIRREQKRGNLCEPINCPRAAPASSRWSEVERPDPKPGHRQVLVKVKACSLNFRDLGIVRGSYRMPVRENVIPLSDGAGEVVEVGPGVTRVKVGDRVAGNFFQRWPGGESSADVHCKRARRQHRRHACGLCACWKKTAW